MARGSTKGAAFERDVAKRLSLWWTDGKRDDVFWRTQSSGGRATQRAKKGKDTFGQHGDLQATDPIGQPLIDRVSIEIKRGYNRVTAFDCLDASPKAKDNQWRKFVKQASMDSKRARVPYWLLVHKRDRRRTLVYMPWTLLRALAKTTPLLALAATPSVVLNLGRRKFFITTLDEFLNLVPPDRIVNLPKKRSKKTKRKLCVRLKR